MDVQYDTLAFGVKEYAMKRYMVVDSEYDFIKDATSGCFTLTYYRQQDMMKPDG